MNKWRIRYTVQTTDQFENHLVSLKTDCFDIPFGVQPGRFVAEKFGNGTAVVDACVVWTK